MRLHHLKLCLATTLLAGGTGCGLDFFAPDAQSSLDDSAGLDSEGDADTDSDADSDSDADGDSDADSDSDTDGPTVEYYDPAYGTAAGGTSVSIIGGPFDDSSVVRFGDAPATVTARTGSTLTARTPAGVEGLADLEVTNTGGSTTVPEAYYYFEDGAGLAGTYGEIYWIEHSGGYWGTAVDFGGAWWTLMVADDFHFWELFAPGADSCRSEYSYPGQIYVYDIEVATTQLRVNSSTIPLSWDAAGLDWSADITRNQFVNNATYELLAMNGGLVPGFSLSPLATTPRDFAVSGPSQLTGQQLQSISRNQLNFTWSSSDATRVVLQLGMTNAAGDAFQEFVTCVANNDGSFSVPSSAFSSWTSGRYLYAYVGAMVESGGTLPTNGSQSRVVGTHYKLYAGVMN